MPRLADTQAAIAHAIRCGSDAKLPDSFFGRRRWNRRFRLHIRHYQASLTSTLLQKFPATEWLVGSQFLGGAASRFVHTCAPSTPCIAEYGEHFPVFLGRSKELAQWAYLESFARLDWLLGKASIAVDAPPLQWNEISKIGPDSLVDSRLTLQPGTRFLTAGYPIDDIVMAYLAGNERPRNAVTLDETFIQIRGSRGAFSLVRIDPGEFAFRRTLQSGLPVGQAAIAAMEVDPNFDAGRALRGLADASLIIAMDPNS